MGACLQGPIHRPRLDGLGDLVAEIAQVPVGEASQRHNVKVAVLEEVTVGGHAALLDAVAEETTVPVVPRPVVEVHAEVVARGLRLETRQVAYVGLEVLADALGQGMANDVGQVRPTEATVAARHLPTKGTTTRPVVVVGAVVEAGACPGEDRLAGVDTRHLVDEGRVDRQAEAVPRQGPAGLPARTSGHAPTVVATTAIHLRQEEVVTRVLVGVVEDVGPVSLDGPKGPQVAGEVVVVAAGRVEVVGLEVRPNVDAEVQVGLPVPKARPDLVQALADVGVLVAEVVGLLHPDDEPTFHSTLSYPYFRRLR